MKPQVVAIGASRVNQFRDYLFAPYSFFNMANTLHSFAQYEQFIDSLPNNYTPDVVMFSLDFFMFGDGWHEKFGVLPPQEEFQNQQFGAFLESQRRFLVQLFKNDFFLHYPLNVFQIAQEPVNLAPAIGVGASLTGRGYRADGSLQHGSYLLGIHLPDEHVHKRVPAGDTPFAPRNEIAKAEWQSFLRFVNKAQERGIQLVAIQTPYSYKVVKNLEDSERHGLWRLTRESAFHDIIEKLDIIYFDFSTYRSFNGNLKFIIDGFHASEPAHINMLLKMLQHSKFNALLASIDTRRLRGLLDETTRYRVLKHP